MKTRLSPSVPAAQACDLYRAMLADSIAAAADSGATEWLVYWLGSPTGSQPLAAGMGSRDQRGHHLGERLRNGFAELLAAPGDRAIVIGADCPELSGPLLRRALEALDASDIVLGPASDGGYVLIGLRAPVPALFDGIDWGTDQVLEQTRGKARSAGRTTTLLETMCDLDTPENLVHFVARAVGGQCTGAGHTRAALRTMGLLPAFG